MRSTISLTEFADRIIGAASKRTGENVSNCIEQLIRKHGGELTRDELQPLDDEKPTAQQSAA